MGAKQSGSIRFLEGYMREVVCALESLPWERVDAIVERLHCARLRRASIFICGNGGSGATASHFVNDLNKGANADGVPRFRAVGLVDNMPLLLAWSNDVGYEVAFEEQLRNLARPGDVIIGISGSGNSPNVLNAISYGRRIGAETIGLTGGQGGRLAAMVDAPLVASTACMEQIEDVHMFLEHAIVSALRDRAQRELVPSLLLAEAYYTLPDAEVSDLAPRGAVFLDRDGVINANRDDYVKTWDEVEFIPNAIEALRTLACMQMPIVVVTNQSAIARGAVTFEEVESINRRLMAHVSAQGGRIDGVVWCPHHPDQHCHCRKPKTGMLTLAAEALHLDLGRSFVVGDAESDVAAGQAVGCRTALVLSGRGIAHRDRVVARWGERCHIVGDLGEAVAWIRNAPALAGAGHAVPNAEGK